MYASLAIFISFVYSLGVPLERAHLAIFTCSQTYTNIFSSSSGIRSVLRKHLLHRIVHALGGRRRLSSLPSSVSAPDAVP